MKSSFVFLVILCGFPVWITGQTKGYFYPDTIIPYLPSYACLEYEYVTEMNYYNGVLTEKNNALEQSYRYYFRGTCGGAVYCQQEEDALQSMLQNFVAYQTESDSILYGKQRLNDSLLQLECIELAREFQSAAFIGMLVEAPALNYCDDCKDYTSEFIAYLERRKNK
jgi:hypothetical protein